MILQLFSADKNDQLGEKSSFVKKVDDKPDEKADAADNFMEKIAHFFADKLHLSSSVDDDEADGRHVLQTGEKKCYLIN